MKKHQQYRKQRSALSVIQTKQSEIKRRVQIEKRKMESYPLYQFTKPMKSSEWRKRVNSILSSTLKTTSFINDYKHLLKHIPKFKGIKT